MQTWEEWMLHICIWGMPAARLVTFRGKHENILSDKFSTIENLGFDMLALSRPALPDCSIQEKGSTNYKLLLLIFACFDLRKGLMHSFVSNTNLKKSF